MDSHLRQLIRQSQQFPETAAANLTEVFTNIKSILADKKPNESLPIGFDIFVLLAEEAVKNGLDAISKECLRIYLSLDAPNNQFRARAFLAQAKLLQPTSSEHPEALEKPIAYVLKTIELCRKIPKYHFLVFNASVVYSELVRPFLKPHFRRFLCQSLSQVVKALEAIDDKDYEWRAELMKILLECYIDAGLRKESLLLAEQAANFVTKNVPGHFKDLLELISVNSLGEHGKLQWWIRGSAELAIYYRLCKLKVAIKERDAEVVPAQEMAKIYRQLLAEDDVTVQAPKGKKDAKKSQAASKADAPAISTKRLSQHSPEKPKLLLELARLAVDQGQFDLATQCLSAIKACPPLPDQHFYTEVEFLNCYFIVKKLGPNEESYAKPIVQLRQQAIERCHEALLNANRQGRPDTIQAGCATQFNLILPLLQPNLRNLVRKPLSLVAQSLEAIDSLQFRLRCQVHIELARIEADLEQVQPALEHLRKAASFDDFSEYREGIAAMQKRLLLRSELYREPDSPEDRACQMLEQAEAASGKAVGVRMRRALLAQVGLALAPDAFGAAMEAENSGAGGGGQPKLGDPTQLHLYAAKASQYRQSIDKISGHLKRLGATNDRVRARLWADLARTARSQEVWDVCRVACRFCLLYDDGRWKNPVPQAKPEGDSKKKKKQQHQQTSPDPTQPQQPQSGSGNASDDHDSDAEKSKRGSVDSRGGSDAFLDAASAAPATRPNLYEKELVRTLAEVGFICAESHVHLVRSQGVQLYERPLPPKDTRKLPRGQVRKDPEADPDWNAYCDWVTELSAFCLSCFVRSAQLGLELNEPWLVTSAAAYVWNYGQHLLAMGRQNLLAQHLLPLVDCLRRGGHDGRTELLVNVCTAAGYGLIREWLPPLPKRQPAAGEGEDGADGAAAPAAKKKPGSGKAKPQAAAPVQISPEGVPDCKRAVEVTAYALDVTNGNRPEDAIAVGMRYPLLQVWLQAKQMCQQAVGKGLGAEEGLDSYDPPRQMTRACAAVEMLWLGRNGVMEFKEAPGVGEAAQMVTDCQWTDNLVALQLWVKLAFIALEMQENNLVLKCSDKALQLDGHLDDGQQQQQPQIQQHRQTVGREHLSLAASLKGQALMRLMQGKMAVRRQAMSAFLLACRHARQARSYQLIAAAARLYWNAAASLVGQPIERQLLLEPLQTMLEAMSATVDRKRLKKLFERPEGQEGSAAAAAPEEDDSPTDPEERRLEQKIQFVQSAPEQTVLGLFPPAVSPPPSAKQLEEDLTLRANMYGVLFQAYADKGDLDKGSKAMDDAIASMPRTKHRLLIFKHRILTRAKLGQSVAMDIQKFRNEPEDKQAELWRIVALSSHGMKSQLEAYKNAIECLTLPEHDWLKVDLLVEFSQWLYTNGFPLELCTAQVDWAIDILLGMAFEEPVKEDTDKKARGKARQKGPPSAASTVASQQSKKAAAAKSAATAGSAKDAAKTLPHQSEAEEKQEKDQQQMILPAEKRIVIGANPSAKPVASFSALFNARQLDNLLRCFCLLARLTTPASPAHRHALHAAHACVLRLFQVALPAGLTATREAAKTKVEEKPGGGGGKGGKGGKGGGKEKEPQKEKPKRKGGLDFVPQTTEDWATYDVPDELLEVFRRQDLMPAAGLGRHNIAKPTITLYYCRLLTEKLRNSGLSHLSLPVLALQDCLTRDLCKSRPANCLVHLTAMDVCLELNLHKGVEFHEFCAGELAPGVDELTENRKMLVQWRERRAQVRREEARARETLAELARELGRDPAELTAAAGAVHGGGGDAEDDSLAGGHLGEQLGELQLHTQWLEMARLLTEQAQYQTARLLLREVQLTASEIGDRRCLAGALQELGRLALREKQFGQAAQCVRQAQAMMQGWASEEDWFLSCQLLIEATAGDYTKKDALSRAKTEALRSIAVFEELGRQRSNKASLIDFLVGRLELLFGRLQIAWALDRLSQRLCSRGRAHRWLEVARRFLHCGLERLTNGRDFRHALECFQQLGTCQMEMSRLASDEEGKRQMLVDAASCFRAATRYAEAFVADAQTSGPPGDLRKVCPPAHRLAAAAKLSLADCLLQLLEIQVDEERTQAELQLAKSADTKAVEEFVQETPRLTESQSAWMSKVRLAFDLAVGQLQDAHSLSAPGGPLPTRAHSLALIGRALRLLASRLDPDSPAQWRLLDIDPSAWPAGDSGDTAAAAAAGTDAEVAEEAGEDKDSSATAVKTPPLVAAAAREREAKAARRTRQAWTAFQRSRDRLAQATEVLQQAQTVALHKDALDVASQASQELLECIGQFDLSIAWQQLTLHQSCETAKQLRRTLRLALRDSNLSETAALINQLDNLEAEAAFCNGLQSRVAAAARDTLRRTSLAWRQSCVDHAHQDIGKSLPPFLGFLALQHSPDCRYLYAGAMERQRAAKPGKAAQSGAGAAGHPLQSRSFVLRRDTSKERLERLLDEVRDFKSEVGTLVLKHEYQRSQAAKQKRMLEAITAGVDGERSGSANQLTEEHKADLELLQTWFARLVADTAEYIGPALHRFERLNRPSSATTVSTSRREQQQQQQPDDCLVLLIDPNLAELPLEALQQLHFDSLSGMSRDFSLQLVARRLFGSKHLLDEDGGAGGGTGDDEEDDDQRAAAVGGGGGGGAGGKAGKDKASKAISRIPGLRDASKKQSKIIPLVRPVPPGHLAVDTSHIRHVVDPYLDCAETEQWKPLDQFRAMMERPERAQQFTPRWLGVTGDDHAPSVGEYEVYLREGTGFIFYGMERFLAHVPPHAVASLGLTDCRLVALFDMAQTSQSFLRQSKIDVVKRSDQLRLEKPVETALLMTLAGVPALCCHQWASTLKENATRLGTFLADVLEGGKTVGQAVNFVYEPYKRANPEDAAAAASDEPAAPATGEAINGDAAAAAAGMLDGQALQDAATATGADAGTAMTETPAGAAATDGFEADAAAANRTSFNMILYGLPNILVTLIDK
ncbi:hypothetical protein BOX15_Mlig026945g4 [Macrostomum lignano]|uniref:Cilia- and flagella-associated protein 46 n=1 Tax=Macrostomum lignano TaxID=282301 RepID=A0A267H1S6_9PLAT|nr:hypothetical protein BOX15_Mlig026945g4 [Macrostomum lignano]